MLGGKAVQLYSVSSEHGVIEVLTASGNRKALEP